MIDGYGSNEARKSFEDRNLTYSDIKEHDFLNLVAIIAKELSGFIFSPHAYSDAGNLKINMKESNYFSDKYGMRWSEIRVDGPYFLNREAITFNPDGFIGFAGWASSDNVYPFIKAFEKWCDQIEKEKQT